MNLRLAAVLAAATLALAACSPEPPAPSPTLTSAPPTPTPTATATPESNPSVGPLAPVELTVAEGTDPGPARGQSLNLPAGWTAEVWANVPGARLAAWTPDGRLLVSNGGGGTVTMLTPTQPGKAPTASALLTGLNRPQGLAFTPDGTTLVVGESDRIVAYDYSGGKATNPRVLVDNLPTSGHGAKGVAISGDTVFYSLGSGSNRDASERNQNPERASIWRVNLDGSGNEMVARGVRNGMALAIAPDGTLFSAVNQMDNQPYPFRDDSGDYGKEVPEFINENPIEQVTRITDGIDLGWPLCVPDTRETPNLLDIPFVNDPVNNPEGDRLDCSTLPNTMLGLPAHSAPLGLSFTAGTPLESVIGQGALVTVHGSWNRTEPREPSVSFAPWDSESATLGVPVPLVTGFQSDAGARWGRSVTAVPGGDGSLYVTDDAAGLVYRIAPG